MPATQYHTTATSRATVTNIKNHGPMKDYPALSLWTADVQLQRSLPPVPVTLTPRVGAEPTPEAFHAALLTDLIYESQARTRTLPAA